MTLVQVLSSSEWHPFVLAYFLVLLDAIPLVSQSFRTPANGSGVFSVGGLCFQIHDRFPTSRSPLNFEERKENFCLYQISLYLCNTRQKNSPFSAPPGGFFIFISIPFSFLSLIFYTYLAPNLNGYQITPFFHL